MRMAIRNNRLAAFFCLLGLAALVPAYFLPSLLMSNAVEGSRWFSIWSGITRFFAEGNYFLAGVIFLFSIVFPIAKLGLTFVSCLGTRFLKEKTAIRIVRIAGWTAKYSMLDVLVIALLIVLVKVKEYIQLIPTVGIYLFSFSILCSVLASLLFVPPGRQHFKSGNSHRILAAAALLAGMALVGGGFLAFRRDAGGTVDIIRTAPLNERVVPRTIERLALLKETYDARDGWLPSRELLGNVVGALQALTSDTGAFSPEYFLTIKTRDGAELESERVKIDLDGDLSLDREWRLPESVAMGEIQTLVLHSRVNYLRKWGTSLEEENLDVDADPYRRWMRVWHGRILRFELVGPPRPLWNAAWWVVGLGTILAPAGAVTLLLGNRRSPSRAAEGMGSEGSL
jgi:paraquat-inducible protein A